MKTYADKILQASKVYQMYCEAQTTSSQPGDIQKAIHDSGVLGLKGETFDVNSKAADLIFGLMDKFGYKGSVSISPKVTAKGQVDLVVSSGDAKLSAEIRSTFLAGVTAAVRKISPPASDIVLKDLVVAKNA